MTTLWIGRGPAVWIALSLLLVGPLVPATASAQEQAEQPDETERAANHFRAALALFDDGDHRGALTEFQRSYRISGQVQILYNIGITHVALQDHARAYEAFSRYLEEGGDAVRESRIETVQAEIERLSRRIGRLQIETNVEGAQIALDGEVVGIAPIERMWVNVGPHRLDVTAEGHERAGRTIEIAGGDDVTIELPLTPITVAPAATETRMPAPEIRITPSTDYAPLALAIGISGALLAGGAVTGVLALDAQQDSTAATEAFPASADDIARTRDEALALSIVTDVLFGLAAVGTGVAIYLGVTAEEEFDTEELSLRIGPGSVAIEGAF